MFSKNSVWLKGLLSVYLLYHFSASLVLPNPRSYIEQHFGFLFYPYSSTLGINTPWQFFSPNPSRNVWYEYETVFENQENDLIPHRWPPDPNTSKMLTPNHMRLVYHSRFSTSSEERKLQFFANYFCRIHPGATAISLKTFVEEPPTMELAAISEQNVRDMVKVKEWPAEMFDCHLALEPIVPSGGQHDR